MPFHPDAPLGQIHIIHDQEYADDAARDADTAWNGNSSNIHKVVLVTGDNTPFMLLTTAPTWFEFGGSTTSVDTIYSADGTVTANRKVTSPSSRTLQLINYDLLPSTFLTGSCVQLTSTTSDLAVFTGDGVGGTNAISRFLLSTAQMQVVDQINSKGLVYAADYSSNFTDRSLVDKAFVSGTYVTGPASALNNELVRFDATTGKLIQGTAVPVYLSDAGFMGFAKSTPVSVIHIDNTLEAKQLITLNEVTADGFQFTGFGYNGNILRTQLANAADDFVIHVGALGGSEKPIMSVNGTGSLVFGPDLTASRDPDADSIFQINPVDSDGFKIKSATNAQMILHDTGAALDLKQANISCQNGTLSILQVDDDLTTFATRLFIDLSDGHVGFNTTTIDSDAHVMIQLDAGDFENFKVAGPSGGVIALTDQGGATDKKQVNLTTDNGLFRIDRYDDDFTGFSAIAAFNLTTGSFFVDTLGASIQRRSSTNLEKEVPVLADEVVEVWQESDFGTAAASIITLVAGTSYHIMDSFSLSSQLKIPTGGSVQIRTMNRSHVVTFTHASLAMFAGTNIGTLALWDCVLDGNSTGTLLNINGGVLSFKFPDFNSWDSMGTVESLTDFFAPGMFIDSSTGLTMISCASCTIVDTLVIISNAGSAAFVINGASSGDLQFYNNILDAGATNSLVNIAGASFPTTNTVNLGGNNIVSGIMFHGSSIDQTDDRVISRGNKGAPDSTATLVGTALDQAGVATVIGAGHQDEPLPITATFTEQSAERFNVSSVGVFNHDGSQSITAQIIASITGQNASGTGVTMNFYLGKGKIGTGIILASDSGAGKVTFTTAAPHGLVADDRVNIQGTTSYNGTFTVTAVTDTTFTVVVTWVTTETGFNPRKILEHTKASNTFSNTDANTMMIAQVDFEEDTFIQLFVENVSSTTNWETSDINATIAKI